MGRSRIRPTVVARPAARTALRSLVIALATSVVAATVGTVPAASTGAAAGAEQGPPPQVQGNHVVHPSHARDKGKVPPPPKRDAKPGHAVPFDIPTGHSFTTPDQAGWTAPELQSAYQIPAANGGTGKLFATVVAFDAANAESDLAQYRAAFGLSPCTTANGCFVKVAQDGSTNYPPATSADWAAEATLDIEMASAACPNCRIALVEASSDTVNDLTAGVTEADRLGAAVVNMSWGASEWSTESAFDGTFTGSTVQYFASSGDCSVPPCPTSWPASSTAVLSVGGTNLQQVSSAPNPSGDLWTENAWSGSISGCSPYETAPSWQAGTSCASGKATPDVSADAGTAIAIYFNPPAGAATPATVPAAQPYSTWGTGWQGAGGTSASSPLAAALWALLGDPLALADGPGLDYYDTAFLPGGGSVNWLSYCGSVPCWALLTGLGSLRGPVPRPGGATSTERFAQNSGEAGPPPCRHGDPVMCATGNLSESVTDLSIPGRGQSLQFSRTYNAQAAVSQTSPAPMGYGWTDDDNAYLSVNTTSGDVTVVQGDGTTVEFAPTSGGHYSAAGWVTATLVKNPSGTYTYTLHDLRSFTFDPSGRLVSQSDRNGYVTTLAYNASGQLASVTDQAGRSLTLAYTAGGEIASVTDPAGRAVSFRYDASGNLTSCTDAAGKVTSYAYDASHRMTTITDPDGGVTTNTYDAANRVVSQRDPSGRTTTYAYTTDSSDGTHTATLTDPLGVQTVQVYDQYDNLIRLTKAANTSQPSTWSYQYEPGTGERTNATDPDGHTTTYTWDAAGDQLSVIDPLQRATTFTYDSAGDVLTRTDAMGVTTTNTYTSHHDLASTSTAVGNGTTSTATYTYSATSPGDLVTVTDPDGHATTYTYDAQGDRTSQTDGAGDRTTWAYDSVGEKTSMVSPRGNVAGGNPAAFTTAYAYDRDGRLISQTDPLGHTTSYAYDGNGNRISVTDAAGATTTSTYDADNELTRVSNPDGTSYGYAYDADGRKTAYTDPSGHTWSYAYDAQGRMTSSTDPLLRTTTYGYDAAGNRTRTTDAAGNTATSTWDAANELTLTTYTPSTTPAASYTYDADGRRTTMSDGTGTTTYAYDGLGRLTSTTSGIGDTVGYSWDAAGNATVLTYAGLTVTRAFDSANRMASVSDGLGGTTTFAYDADGNLTTERYPNGIVATYGYDADDHGSSIRDAAGATGVAAFSYTRTADELLATAVETTPTGPVSTPALEQSATVNDSYGYSALQRLTTANGGTYSYDSTGDLTAVGAQGETLRYDAANEVTSLSRPAPQGGTSTTTYGYDGRGDRTSATTGGVTTTLEYDAAGRLVSFGSATYTYNGDGLRMTKQIPTAAGGVITSDFVWDTATTSVPLVLFDTANTYVYGPGGRPVEQLNLATSLFLHQDQLGSTRMLTDMTGGIVATFGYDPYGNPTVKTGSATTPLGFAGQYTDAESGLLYMRARYYDPVTSQFVTVDPQVASTLAPYSYAADDPLNATDPLGLDCGWFSWACDAGHWVEHNFGTVASVGAAGACIAFSLGVCAGAVGAAFLARSAQRWIYEGGSKSLGSDALDAFITGATFGFVGVPGAIGLGEAPEWLNAALGISAKDAEAAEEGLTTWSKLLAKVALEGPDLAEIAADLLMSSDC